MRKEILSQLLAGESAVAVIGLGYTGLPLALALASKFKVIGYDKDFRTVTSLQSGIDPRGEVLPPLLKSGSVHFTDDETFLAQAVFFIIAVPTPVDHLHDPDLSLLEQAMQLTGRNLKRGDCVVLESTVYPGCTEEFCVPLLEKVSGMTLNIDFAIGYSPERINPGDKEHRLETVVKLIAGSDENALNLIQAVYQSVAPAGLHRCSSIKVAEAAKMTENIQRDVNIALMNELAQVYSTMNIDTAAIWEAASTKWNFLPFRPGLAGGHCISVDPYYLLFKARQLGVEPALVASARQVNEAMVTNIEKLLLAHLEEIQKPLPEATILIMGVSFKGNVRDLRNSKVLELAGKLKQQGLAVELSDPLVEEEELKAKYGWTLTAALRNNYDIIVLGADHADYCKLGEDYFCAISGEQSLIIDLKGIFRGKIKKRKYRSL